MTSVSRARSRVCPANRIVRSTWAFSACRTMQKQILTVKISASALGPSRVAQRKPNLGAAHFAFPNVRNLLESVAQLEGSLIVKEARRAAVSVLTCRRFKRSVHQASPVDSDGAYLAGPRWFTFRGGSRTRAVDRQLADALTRGTRLSTVLWGRQTQPTSKSVASAD